MDNISDLLDDLEEKLGCDDAYCELATEWQNVSDEIKRLEARVILALSK